MEVEIKKGKVRRKARRRTRRKLVEWLAPRSVC